MVFFPGKKTSGAALLRFFFFNHLGTSLFVDKYDAVVGKLSYNPSALFISEYILRFFLLL